MFEKCPNRACVRGPPSPALPGMSSSGASVEIHTGWPMWRFSLKFQSKEKEAGFLQYSAARLPSGVVAGATTMLCITSFLLISHNPATYASWYGVSTPQKDSRFWWTYGSVILVWLLSVAALLVAIFRRLHRCLGFLQREVLVSGLTLLVVAQTIFTSPWYLARASGMDHCDLYSHALCRQRLDDGRLVGNISGSDSTLVLELSIFILATHFLLSIRWIVVVQLEVAVIAMYGVAGRVLGSPEGAYVDFVIFLLMVLTFLAALGKRQLEYSERILFRQLLQEKQLRAQAEFQLSKAREDAPRAEETASNSTGRQTSALGRMIQQGLHMEHSQCESLVEIGQREQWLVDAADLVIARSAPILGSGGFGIVAAGRFQRTPVAVKVIQENTTNHSLASIGNELRILRKLHHPNIVLFHGACVDFQTGDIALVLERVFGISFDAFVGEYHATQDKPIQAIYWAFQLLHGACRALVYLHARQPPIVHGDLKASNIFVERHFNGPHAKLLDFGMARVLSRRTLPLGGTLSWQAPEVFMRGAPTAAADVFSFGRVIYFLHVGKKPLADYEQKVIRSAGMRKRVLPLSWPQPMSAEVEWVKTLVCKTSRPQPERRPPIAEVCIDIEDATRSLREGVARVEACECEAIASIGEPSTSSFVDSAAAAQEGEAQLGGSAAAAGFWAQIGQLRQDFINTTRPRRERPKSEKALSGCSENEGQPPQVAAAPRVCHRESL